MRGTRLVRMARGGPKTLANRWISAALLLLAGTLAAGPATAVAASAQPIDIGVIAPLTGSQAELGHFISDGCFAAAVEINRAGGVLGHKIQCVLIDDTGDPADAVPNVTRALATTTFAGMVGVDSDVAAAIVPIVNNAHIPMMSSNGLSEFIHNTFPYFWRLNPPDIAQGAAMGIWAQRLGVKRAAVVVQNDVGDTGNLPGIVKALQNAHVAIVADYTIPGDSSSYESLAARAKARDPQVIVMSGDTETIATFLANYRVVNHGVVPPLITTAGNMAPDFYSALKKTISAGYLVHDAYFIGSYSNPNPEAAHDYLLGLEGSPQVKDPQVVSHLGPIGGLYDGINVMALAMVEARSVVGAKYNRYIPDVATMVKGAVVVHNFAQGEKAILAGKRVAYVGTVGPIKFDKYHNSPGWFAAFSFTGSQGSVMKGVISPAELSASLR
jgi:ABC-type branched-subunit amino acid transport system substrate-binding protein